MPTATVSNRPLASPARDYGRPRYASCVKASKRMRWDIERDVVRGRDFDYERTFLPTRLSHVDELEFLDAAERRLLGQVQGRTYAYFLGLVERFIGAKVLQLSRRHWPGDPVTLKHQELFRRLEAMLAARMPAGHVTTTDPNAVARFVLGRRTWAVLALACHVELFTQAHFQQSIALQEDLCPLWKDVFMHHWQEERQQAVLDQLEWAAEHARLDAAERDAAVDDLIEFLDVVDRILQSQAAADARYFVEASARPFTAAERERIGITVLRAYRSQYIVSGVEHPRYSRLLGGMTTAEQIERIMTALRRLLLA